MKKKNSGRKDQWLKDLREVKAKRILLKYWTKKICISLIKWIISALKKCKKMISKALLIAQSKQIMRRLCFWRTRKIYLLTNMSKPWTLTLKKEEHYIIILKRHTTLRENRNRKLAYRLLRISKLFTIRTWGSQSTK